MKRSAHAATLAARLASDLFEAEIRQDDAVAQLGKLAQSLTQVRREAGLSTTVGQSAFDALADAVAAQVQAQRAMVALHGALADVKAKTVFRGVELNGLDKTPDDPVRPPEAALLALVA